MDLYKKLARIFELDTIDIDKANRKTLLNYAKRSRFQKRREAYYSVCESGTKSKVAICKTLERPHWVQNLETLKTKQLRNQLKGFLSQLGILMDPQKSNLKKLAKERNWDTVLNLKQEDDDFDDSKKGSGDPPTVTPGGPDDISVVDAPRDTMEEEKTAPRRVVVPGLAPSLAEMAAFRAEQTQILADAKQSMKTTTEEKLITKVKELTDTIRKTDVIPKADPPLPPPSLEQIMAAAGGGADEEEHPVNVKVVKTGGKNCFFLNEDEHCVCDPKKIPEKQMAKSVQRKLRRLAEEHAITCSKINLMRCLCVEMETQRRLWRKFGEVPQGDFLAEITANQVKELACGKNNVVFSAQDLHTMKSVANCFNMSQNLCRGHQDSSARFKDKKAIGKDYTLGHLGYEELLKNVRKFGDPWSEAAYRNRIPDPLPQKTMFCEDLENNETSLVNVESSGDAIIPCPDGKCPSTQFAAMPTTVSGPGPGPGPLPPGPPPSGPPRALVRSSGPSLTSDFPQRRLEPSQKQTFQRHPTHSLEPKERTDFKPHEMKTPLLYAQQKSDLHLHPVGKELCIFIQRSLVYLRTKKPADKPKNWNLPILNQQVGLIVQRIGDKDMYFGDWLLFNFERLRDYVKPGRGQADKIISQAQYEYLVHSLVGICDGTWRAPNLPEGDMCTKLLWALDFAQTKVIPKGAWGWVLTQMRFLLDQTYPESFLNQQQKDKIESNLKYLKKSYGIPQPLYIQLRKSIKSICEYKPGQIEPEKPTPVEKDPCVIFEDLLGEFWKDPNFHNDKWIQMMRIYATKARDFLDPIAAQFILQAMKGMRAKAWTPNEAQWAWIQSRLVIACSGTAMPSEKPKHVCDLLDYYMVKAQMMGLNKFEWDEFWTPFLPVYKQIEDFDQRQQIGRMIAQLRNRELSKEAWFQLRAWIYEACWMLDKDKKKKKDKIILEDWKDPDPPIPKPPLPWEDIVKPEKWESEKDICARFLNMLELARTGAIGVHPGNDLQRFLDAYLHVEVLGEANFAMFQRIIEQIKAHRGMAIPEPQWQHFIASMRAVCEHNRDGDMQYRPDDPCYRIDFLMSEAWRAGLGGGDWMDEAWDVGGWPGWPELLGLLQNTVYAKMTATEIAFVRPIMDSRLGTIGAQGQTDEDTYKRVRKIIFEACQRDADVELGDQKEHPEDEDEKKHKEDEDEKKRQEDEDEKMQILDPEDTRKFRIKTKFQIQDEADKKRQAEELDKRQFRIKRRHLEEEDEKIGDSCDALLHLFETALWGVLSPDQYQHMHRMIFQYVSIAAGLTETQVQAMHQFLGQVYSGNRTSLSERDISSARDLIEYACRKIGMTDPRPRDPCARLDFMLVEAYLMGIRGRDWDEIHDLVTLLLPSIPAEHHPLIRNTLRTLHELRAHNLRLNMGELDQTRLLLNDACVNQQQALFPEYWEKKKKQDKPPKEPWKPWKKPKELSQCDLLVYWLDFAYYYAGGGMGDMEFGRIIAAINAFRDALLPDTRDVMQQIESRNFNAVTPTRYLNARNDVYQKCLGSDEDVPVQMRPPRPEDDPDMDEPGGPPGDQPGPPGPPGPPSGGKQPPPQFPPGGPAPPAGKQVPTFPAAYEDAWQGRTSPPPVPSAPPQRPDQLPVDTGYQHPAQYEVAVPGAEVCDWLAGFLAELVAGQVPGDEYAKIKILEGIQQLKSQFPKADWATWENIFFNMRTYDEDQVYDFYEFVQNVCASYKIQFPAVHPAKPTQASLLPTDPQLARQQMQAEAVNLQALKQKEAQELADLSANLAGPSGAFGAPVGPPQQAAAAPQSRPGLPLSSAPTGAPQSIPHTAAQPISGVSGQPPSAAVSGGPPIARVSAQPVSTAVAGTTQTFDPEATTLFLPPVRPATTLDPVSRTTPTTPATVLEESPNVGAFADRIRQGTVAADQARRKRAESLDVVAAEIQQMKEGLKTGQFVDPLRATDKGFTQAGKTREPDEIEFNIQAEEDELIRLQDEEDAKQKAFDDAQQARDAAKLALTNLQERKTYASSQESALSSLHKSGSTVSETGRKRHAEAVDALAAVQNNTAKQNRLLDATRQPYEILKKHIFNIKTV